MTRCKCGRYIESGFICCFCFKDSGDLYSENREKSFWTDDDDERTAEELIDQYEDSGSDDT